VKDQMSITGAKNRDIILLAACSTAIATLVPVTLYQVGALSSLPDPPSPIFDSEFITTSKAAHPLGIPDGLLGLASFGVTLTLILAAKRSPAAKKLLGVKLIVDGAAGVFNASRQVVIFGKLCSWCTGTAIAAGLMACAGRDIIRESVSAGADIASSAAVAYAEGDQWIRVSRSTTVPSQ
jgi:uncharacterized membrane protein